MTGAGFVSYYLTSHRSKHAGADVGKRTPYRQMKDDALARNGAKYQENLQRYLSTKIFMCRTVKPILPWMIKVFWHRMHRMCIKRWTPPSPQSGPVVLAYGAKIVLLCSHMVLRNGVTAWDCSNARASPYISKTKHGNTKTAKRGDRVIYTKLTPYENYGHGLNAYDELVVAKDMQPSDQSVICFLPDAETDGLLHPAWCL